MKLVMAPNGFSPVGGDDQIHALAEHTYPIKANSGNAGEKDTGVSSKLVTEASAAASVLIAVPHR